MAAALRRTRLLTWLPAALVVATTAGAPTSVAGGPLTLGQLRASAFCKVSPVNEEVAPRRERPRLLPRNEAARDPDLAAFQRRLLDAVARRDVSAILRMSDRAVKLDFGGGEGIEFLEQMLANASSNFWREFPRALALGGTFRGEDFSAPYVFSAWPDGFDPFECAAIVGHGVRLREGPGPTARTLTTLDYDIVEQVQEAPDTPGWTRVRTALGQQGFVASQFVRSPSDYRARFARRDGQWRLMAFLAGD